MAIDPEALLAWQLPSVTQDYGEADTILYALGLGIGQDPLDPMQLQFVHEDGLRTLPTMGAVLGAAGPWLSDPATGVDYTRVVHGEQHLEITRPLPAAGRVRCVNRVVSVADRGSNKGTAVAVARELYGDADGQLVSRQVSVLIARGDGGFGGANGDTPVPELRKPPERDADMRFDWRIPSQAALIYRLSGDRNPLHALPQVAQRGGFERPILHGLASFGIAAFAATATVCNGDPDRLRSIAVRFTAPVLPGDTLAFDLWRVGVGEAAFRARVVERDRIVLDNGWVRHAA